MKLVAETARPHCAALGSLHHPVRNAQAIAALHRCAQDRIVRPEIVEHHVAVVEQQLAAIVVDAERVSEHAKRISGCDLPVRIERSGGQHAVEQRIGPYAALLDALARERGLEPGGV